MFAAVNDWLTHIYRGLFLHSPAVADIPEIQGCIQDSQNTEKGAKMDDDTRQFVPDEEVEFVYNEQTFIYRFRSRDSISISFRRIWNTPGHTPESAWMRIYPEAVLPVINAAVLVLYKAATWKPGMPMPQFIPAMLSKLLKWPYSSKEMLEQSMKGSIDTFGTVGGIPFGKEKIAELSQVMNFLEPYTPWGVLITNLTCLIARNEPQRKA